MPAVRRSATNGCVRSPEVASMRLMETYRWGMTQGSIWSKTRRLAFWMAQSHSFFTFRESTDEELKCR